MTKQQACDIILLLQNQQVFVESFSASKMKARKSMKERFETFTVLVAKINRSIRKIKSEEMAEYNLKAPHVSCLYYLYKRGALTATELCDICDEDKGAVSRSVDYLEREEYITCDSDSKKRYKAPLALTEKGMRIGKQVAEKIDNVLYHVGHDMTDEERERFYHSLEIISEDLHRITDEYDNRKEKIDD